MELILEHDGSYPGFLCATAEYFNHCLGNTAGKPSHNKQPSPLRYGNQTRPPGNWSTDTTPPNSSQPAPRPIIKPAGQLCGLFEDCIAISTDPERAAAFLHRLSKRAGSTATEQIRQAFGCDQTQIDGLHLHSALAGTLLRLWQDGPAGWQRLDDPAVAAANKAYTRASREMHLFQGITRFAELSDQSMYAPIRPACDILDFLAPHFGERFAAQRWILHDSGRNIAILHCPQRGLLRTEGFELAEENVDTLHSSSEKHIQSLWQQYFNSVAIQSRINPRCQRSFLPLKHRHKLPEFAPTIDSQAKPDTQY
ncbi:MAG: TIGR03915 family putative DNA repair protein [Spirochaetes bacterium]|nr:TIGR03915 family putative DNA repair protein [Spirochaetota bacterium]